MQRAKSGASRRHRLCSGGSTRNTLPARVPLLSVPPRCSLRGCRPSPPAAVAAVVPVPVPCATYRLPRSFAGHFRRWRRGLVFFRRCLEAGGSFCAGPRRPGPCAGGCPGGFSCGVPALLLPALQFSSPAHGGSSQPPDNTSNKIPQPAPKRKAPWKPRQTRCRRCPCHSGGESRVVPVASNCRAAVPAGTDSSAAWRRHRRQSYCPTSGSYTIGLCAGMCGTPRQSIVAP